MLNSIFLSFTVQSFHKNANGGNKERRILEITGANIAFKYHYSRSNTRLDEKKSLATQKRAHLSELENLHRPVQHPSHHLQRELG